MIASEELQEVHTYQAKRDVRAFEIACARYLGATLVSLVYMKAIQFMPYLSLVGSSYCKQLIAVLLVRHLVLRRQHHQHRP